MDSYIVAWRVVVVEGGKCPTPRKKGRWIVKENKYPGGYVREGGSCSDPTLITRPLWYIDVTDRPCSGRHLFVFRPLIIDNVRLNRLTASIYDDSWTGTLEGVR